MDTEVKCIRCGKLKREVVVLSGRQMVVYDCPGRFPYQAALSGLLRPGKGIKEAADYCPGPDESHCILCDSTAAIRRYGIGVILCKDHATAWGTWINTHPERREYIAPGQRVKSGRWVEVFREFVEDERKADATAASDS